MFYKDLTEQALRIVKVTDFNGNQLDFKTDAEYFICNRDALIVNYEYLPPNYDLEDQIGYLETDISAGILSYGVNAEYSICEGRFNEAVMWHKRYADHISEICLPKNKRLKGRVWA